MNIKISKAHRDLLLQHTTDHILFGSSDGEDKDWLCIVEPNTAMDAALHNRDHFLFYKDEEIKEDFLFATPRCLINGMITGTSTLLYELLVEGKLRDTSLDLLCNAELKIFCTQKLAKAFVGVAQRDLKQCAKLEGQERVKKLGWVETYVDIVLNMFKICGIESNAGRNLELIRAEVSKLPKYTEDANYLLYFFDEPKYNKKLSSVADYYYKSWGESL